MALAPHNQLPTFHQGNGPHLGRHRDPRSYTLLPVDRHGRQISLPLHARARDAYPYTRHDDLEAVKVRL